MTLCTHGIFTRLLRPGVACASKMGEGDRRARFVAASSRRRVRVLGPRDLHLLLRLARLELPPAAVSYIIIAAEIRIIIAAVTCIIIVDALLRQRADRRVARDGSRITADVQHARAVVLAVAITVGVPVDGHELVFVYPQALLIAELRRRDIQYHTEVQVAGAVALPASVGRLIGNTIATVLLRSVWLQTI